MYIYIYICICSWATPVLFAFSEAGAMSDDCSFLN